MPIDPAIALSFQPQNLGPNLGQAVNTAGQIMAFQQQQQAVQQQNKLRGILGAPGAIDDTGQPTPDAMKQVMAVDPNTGMKLRQNALVMQQQQLQQQSMKTKLFQDQAGMVHDISERGLVAYEDAKSRGLPEPEAIKAGQGAYDEGMGDARKSGLFSDAQLGGANTAFDPIRARSMVQTVKDFQQQQKDQIAAAKVKEDEARDDRKEAETERYHRATEGRGDFANPIEVEYKGPDGKPVRVLAQQDKTNGGWVTADQDRKALPGGVQIVKPPIPGSVAANRAAIADDLNNDPEWKDKTPGQRAAEVEQRVAIAGGRLTDPNARHSMAEEIASYQLGPLSGYALTKPGGPETMAEVLKINPDYQGARYPEINKAMTAFGSGKQGDTLRSLNVATQHLGVIDDAAEALKNGNVQTFNRIGNKIAEELGVAAPTTFDALKQIVGTEIEKAVAGGIGAVADRDRLMKSLDGANSPAQLEAVSQDFKKLMAGQAKGLKTQYEDATGFKSGPFSFDKKLMPATMKALGMVEAEGGGRFQPTAGGNQPAAMGNQPAFYTGDTPPAAHPDAKKAPDGNWYVKNGNKWAPVLAVEPSEPPAGAAAPATATPAPAASAAPAQTSAQQPAATPPPPGAHAVPKAQANDPDGTTYNGGKLVKKGGFIVPAPAASGSAGDAKQGDPLEQARTAIASGAPRDAVIKRLRDNGVDPAGL